MTRLKPEYGTKNQSYLAAGELEGLFRLVTDFYQIMETEPFAKTIRDMHPKNLEVAIDKLARFLSGWLGGPKLYQMKHGSISIPGVHRPFIIDMPEHDAWLKCMEMALVKQDYAQDFKDYLLTQLKVPASRIVAVNRKNRENNRGR